MSNMFQDGRMQLAHKHCARVPPNHLRVLEVPTTIRSSTADPQFEKEKPIEKLNETDYIGNAEDRAQAHLQWPSGRDAWFISREQLESGNKKGMSR
jgi:hypothetical protein